MTNHKSTKRALLGSVMAMVLCLAMLVGATFAWFTDTASTGVNKIQAGNLDIEIQDENGNEVKNLAWKTQEGTAFDIDKETPLWEPGCTYTLTPFKIVNTGNLALKYKIVITGLDGDSKLLDVIKFTYKTADGKTFDMDAEGHLAANGGTTGMITVSAHMDEAAGNDYMNKTLEDVEFTVYATQDTVEYDSINNQYDKDATLDFVTVSNQTELQDAINAAAPGEDVNLSLTGDITIEDTLYVIGKNVGADVGDVTIQANGKTLTSEKQKATRCMRIEYTDVQREITIIGAKVVSEGMQAGYNADENRGLALYDVKNATINLVNCEIEMKANNYAYAIKMINCENVTLNLTDCTLTGANCIETNGGSGNTVNIADCVLNSNYAPNAEWCGQGIQDKNGNNNTFNIKNTTFNGTNAQPWETNATTTINDLGGNVNNTTRTYE